MKKVSCFLLFVLLIVACKSTKDTVKVTPSSNAKVRFESYLGDQIKYESLQSKLHVEFVFGGKTLSSRATLKIKRDEFIQLSVQPVLGIEMFRLVITPDNVLLIDKMNRRYLSESIDVLEDMVQMKMDFNLVQALFTNQMFTPYQKGRDLSFHSFDSEMSEEGIKYVPKKKSAYDCSFYLDIASHLVQTEVADNGGRNRLLCSYQNFSPVENRPYPLKMIFNLSSQIGDVQISLGNSDIQFNKSVKADMSVSNRYQKVSLSQIKGMLF